jgi:hypothetical protein
VIGAGSVGSFVASSLVRAGVGNLSIVDPDSLSTANIGRHALGAGDLGTSKAEALAQRLLRDFPHMKSAEGYRERWQAVLQSNPTVFENADLIISAMGNWAAETELNDWHIERDRRPNVLYGWTEANACAGHAVVVTEQGGCFQCGFDRTGVPLAPITTWPDSLREKREPACGAGYQPYGPVELAHIVAMIAGAALACILKQESPSWQRVWVAPRQLLLELGGEWSAEWKTRMGGDIEGGFIKDLSWPPSGSCPACGPH